ncbi:MAG: hypothetical protein COU10_00520 [Candidatus Harrisonbacteria bacterium CG10_big_fil_rev_8_21_14_0_10_45_28]|uniref:Uncharacterized protein n=1 Tax=Candidatus Harrisonbacteria bacterium CG10_big_fil_rev_8_21_14_0_10_45_28 TaxID=1974586 RepID=A0A2H0UP76_9BACT|nr:MAG: hypothetical protein COU10_00520 [Candidatus Harrisonbacteria bacterium CG10_big_fil_rev_8_21_14_0_10_45_28]
MNRRVKQFLYGGGYAIILVAIFIGSYFAFFAPAPSCFDKVQNQDEVGVDCGGGCGGNCAILSVRSIEVSKVESVVVRDVTIAVVEIRNPNANFGVKSFDYTLNLADAFGENMLIRDTTSIYSGEVRYRVLVDVPVSPSGDSFDALPYTLSTSSVRWIEAELFLRPQSQVRDTKSEYDSDRRLLVAEGVLQNSNDFAVKQAAINAVVRDRTGKLIGASKTLVKELPPQGERYFQVVVPIIAGVAEGDIAPVKITVEMVR